MKQQCEDFPPLSGTAASQGLVLGDGEAGERAADALEWARRLKQLQQELAVLRNVANALVPGAQMDKTTTAPTSLASLFGHADSDYARAVRRASECFEQADDAATNDAVCEVARLVHRELRCFLAALYQTQVDTAPTATKETTEFFRDKWADGRPPQRAPIRTRASKEKL